VNTVINQAVQHQLAYLSMQSMADVGRPFYLTYWLKQTHPYRNADFQLTFAHNASAITPSKKSSISTNGKSMTGFPMSLRCAAYVAPKPPNGAQKPFSSKI